MDINKNYQINTFIKGMDTDTSDMYLEDSQYRMAENVRLLTNTDSNSGELHLIEGTTLYNVEFYKVTKDGDKEEQGNIWKDSYILATDSVRNIGIVILKEGDAWSIYKIDFDVNEGYLLFGPCVEPIWTTNWENEKQISTVTRWESDTNVKLYIADRTEQHQLMSIQIHDNYYLGDTFDKMFSYQRILLPPPIAEISDQTGSIKAGVIFYAYRLYTEAGNYTPLSPVSKKVVTYKTNYSGYEQDETSGRAVKITINPQERDFFQYIQLYRILYNKSSEIPEISLILDRRINDVGVTYIDSSDIAEESDISFEDFLSQISPRIIPKYIESKEDYLFAANIKYAQDEVDTLFKDFDARCYSPGMKVLADGDEQEVLKADWDTIKNENLVFSFYDENGCLVWNKEDWQLYYTQNDLENGPLTPTETPDVQYAWYNNNRYMENITPYEGVINGIGKNLCWRYVYEDVADNALTAQNQTGTIKESTSTFRSEECYRFGIRLFDKYGNSSSVKWISDIIMPNILTSCKTKYRNVGIQFFINTFYTGWQNNWDGISAVEIVRCNRTISDKCTITQGITGFPYAVQHENKQTLVPVHYVSMEKINFNYNSTSSGLTVSPLVITSIQPQQNVVMFCSPENSYMSDDVKSIFNAYTGNLYTYPSHKLDVDSEHLHNTFITVKSPISAIPDQTEELDIIRPKSIVSNPAEPYWIVKKYNAYEGKYYPTSTMEYVEISNNYGANATDNVQDIGTTYFRYNYITATGTPQTYNCNPIKIGDFEFVKSPRSDHFSNFDTLTYMDDSTVINNLNFINWTVLAASLSTSVQSGAGFWKWDPESGGGLGLNRYPIGSGGSCILMSSEEISSQWGIEDPPSVEKFMRVYVQNVKKPVIPYDGVLGIKNSKYESHGDFIKINIQDLAQNPPILINVFSGDTKLRVYTYNASHNFWNQRYAMQNRMGTSYVLPLECDIDIQAQYGTLFGVDGVNDYRVQDYPDSVGSWQQEVPAYDNTYNPIYNASLELIAYSEKQDQKNKNNIYDTRIFYSHKKTNNESLDSWNDFQALNYRDVDSRYGEITGLKLFKNKLIFWQERAAGVLSVNEKVALSDTNGSEIVLGHGSTLERFDYITTTYGLQKNSNAYDVSENYLYWWDGNHKEILQVSEKDQLVPLTVVKHVRNYINRFDDDLYTPSMVYDNLYKEILCNVKNNESIVYNEFVDKFTAVYKFTPIFKITHGGNIYLSDRRGPLYMYNKCTDNKSQLFGQDSTPLVRYTINKNPEQIKVYDTQEIGGRFYGGGEVDEKFEGLQYNRVNTELSQLKFAYKTPLKQSSETSGNKLSNIEYAYKLAIPRNGQKISNGNFDAVEEYGNRMRGNTMQCEFKSTSNSLDFSLQYITTKFRISWT